MPDALPQDAQAALRRLAALFKRERAAAAEQYAAERRGVSLAERVTRGLALRQLSIDETGAAAGGRTLLWISVPRAADLDDTRLGPGDPVRLWWDDPDQADAVRGVVSRKQRDRLAVMIDGDVPERLEEGAFNLDRDEPTATFDRGDRALQRFIDADPKSAPGLVRLREILFGGRAPEFEPEPTIAAFDSGLNEAQRAAVRRALAARELALIHGPPGTGKTRTLVEVIRQIVARGERVLATAASNAAVDHLAEQLVNVGVPVVRLGHPARVAKAMEERTLDALLDASDASSLARRWLSDAAAIRRRVRAKRGRGSIAWNAARQELADARALERDARKHLSGAQDAILERCPVIAATAAGADTRLLERANFDWVVLDEATQAADPIALVALSRAPRVVMGGDPRQLPPTVLDREAAKGGLASTAFERLADDAARAPSALRLLVEQHRMHEDIMAFPSQSMYGGSLIAARAVARHTLADLGVTGDATRPRAFHFIDTSGRGWNEARSVDDPSTSNPGEAERVAVEARRLLARGLAPGDLAIITPYDAQVRLLCELLAEQRRAGVEIGTVDGFQGREKEAVIVSLVRSNEDAELGFLNDTRRMNVALTRARRCLLVVGDGATLGHHPYYGAFLTAAEQSGAWISAWDE